MDGRKQAIKHAWAPASAERNLRFQRSRCSVSPMLRAVAWNNLRGSAMTNGTPEIAEHLHGALIYTGY